MSQFFVNTSVSSGGGVTQVNSEDGNATPTGGVIIVSADDTTANDTNGIRTVGGGQDGTAANEVRVEITNRVEGSDSTTGSNTADIPLLDFTALPNGCYTFTLQVSAYDSGTPSAGSYFLNGGVLVNGGTPTIIDGAFSKVVLENPAITGADANASVSGNILNIRVKGTGSLSINWNVVGQYSRSV